MSTSADRGWMYAVEGTDRFLSYTFCSNLDVFLDFAFSNKAFVDNNHIKCPCLECDNKHFKSRNEVMFHLYEKGFTPNYTTWSAHGETSTSILHEEECSSPVEDDECARMVVDELGLTNVNYTTDDVTTARIQLKGECYSPIEDDGCTRMVVDEVGTTKVDNTTYESNCDSDVLEGTEGCRKNLKVKLNSELFKSKSKVTRRCQKDLKVNQTSELFNSKSKGTRRCQKDLKVNLTSELFKSKSKGTRRCQKDLKVNLTSDELFKSKSKNKIIKPVLPQNETKKIMKRMARLNTQCVSNTDSRLSIFKHPGQKLFEDRRTYKHMYDAMTIAHRYILFNCEEVKPFIRLFDDLTRQQQPYIDEGGFDTYRQNFAEWFKKHVHQGSNDISQDLIEIAQGPKAGGYTYKGYSISGYKFHSQKHSERNVTKMNGVCLRGSVSNGHMHDYYGILDEIIEVEYYSKNRGSGGCVVVLFKCKWFDTPGGVGVERKNDLVHIDSKAKLLTDHPFVLPSYTEQVFYAPYRSMSKELKDWWDLVKSQN